MKRLALILALVLILTACAEIPPPADTAPPRPAETTAPVETTQPPETTNPPENTSPPETTVPTADFSEYAALLDFTADPNWLSRSIGCVYEKPEDVDLYYLFYLGVEHPGSWDDISEGSRQSLIDQDFFPEFDLQIMPCDKLEEALQTTFGIGLDDVAIPESWGYIEKENAYCSMYISTGIFPAFRYSLFRRSPQKQAL